MYYLQLDGSTPSYIQAPSMTYDEIELDIVSEFTTGMDRYYLDSRTGAASAYFYKTNSTQVDTWGANFAKIFIDDVQVTASSGSAAVVPLNQRVKVRLQANMTNNTNLTDDITFFARYTIAQYFKGKAYGIKIWLDGVLQAHYDLTLGNVQDQSGNGNHATLTGGTWVQDAAGSTPITVNAVQATATADALNPVVTTQYQISVSSVIADSAVEAIAPTVEAIRNMSASVPTASSIADALAPFVGSSESAQITATIATLTVDAVAPTVTTTTGTRIDAVSAEAAAESIAPSLSIDTVIQAFVAGLEAQAMAPALNAKVIVGVIELNGKRELYVYLVGKQELNVNLKGVLN